MSDYDYPPVDTGLPPASPVSAAHEPNEDIHEVASNDIVARLSIANPEAALEAISHAYAPSKLDVYGTTTDFDLTMHVAKLPGMTYGHTRFNTEVRVTALPPSCYVVCFARTGSLQVAATGTVQSVAGTKGAVLYPYEATYFEKWGAESELVSLRIEEEFLERGLVRLIEQPLHKPIRFEPGCDLDASHNAAFRRALQLLEVELTDPSALAQNARANTLLSELVITALLLSQPNNYSEIIHEPVKTAPAGPVRSAQELIDADPMSVGTVVELANLVHTSVRSLEQGFQKYLGTSPMAYLRQARLSCAHRDLQLADPATSTVRRTANSWGFQHLGRFAKCYRDAYGELPAETLRSARR